LRHFASPQFWGSYQALPSETRELAERSFTLLKLDPRHPSLRLKRLGKLWSVRVGDHYRALGTDVPGGILWVWIGTHADYDRITG
jgi:mRNA-degrading endonuclease RelE of RelBE toxin-antitoxin system